jgi:hypothetical protein
VGKFQGGSGTQNEVNKNKAPLFIKTIVNVIKKQKKRLGEIIAINKAKSFCCQNKNKIPMKNTKYTHTKNLQNGK